ncbi:MAG: sigma 54-interacting transcriptional regulator [Clostridium sp.]|nr:sigma 54-interacting transcriptional regulator [Clostridium sp.]
MEEYYRLKLKDLEYYDIDELISSIGSDVHAYKDFVSAIGYDSSLSYCIMQLQSAVRYPPHGLPVFLYGEPGVGKKLLCRLAYEYAVNEQLLDKNACLIYTDSNIRSFIRISDNGQDSGELDGEENERLTELLKLTKNGFLVIHNAENLTKECLRNLVGQIDNSAHGERKDGRQYSFSSRLIFTSNKDSLDEIFVHSVPVVSKIPSLDERPVADKEKLILHYFRKEEQRLGKKIMLSGQVFQALVSFQFKYNVEEVIACIKSVCASANLEQKRGVNELTVYSHHLIGRILSSVDKTLLDTDDGQTLMSLDEYAVLDRTDKIISFFEILLSDFQILHGGELSKDKEQFYRNCTHNMNTYYEYMMFEKRKLNDKTKAYEAVLRKILDYGSEKYNLFIPSNCAYVLAKVVYQIKQEGLPIRDWSNKNKSAIDELLSYCRRNYEAEYHIACEISSQARQLLNMEFDSMNLIFLTMNLSFYNKEIKHRKSVGIIIAHGFATATSIAETANKAIGAYIFEAVDMPWDTGMKDIVTALKRKIQKRNDIRELILMVDTGGLENIGHELGDFSNITIGIINNVSTWLAVNVGEKILKGMEIGDILQQACQEYTCSFRLLKLKEKEAAILFTSETGAAPTERVIQLFENSFPKNIGIKILPCDYSRMSEKLKDDPVFEKYHVLFVVGTVRINLEHIPFITLENLINAKSTNIVNSVFRPYFSESEIEQFNMNLVKNFSLENIMHYLSVLDADKLLSYIEASLIHLQELMGRKFSNDMLIGAYIHISNLIERLVTRTLPEVGEILPKNQEEQIFVDNFKESFSRAENHYNIQIPISEMLYVYANLK